MSSSSSSSSHEYHHHHHTFCPLIIITYSPVTRRHGSKFQMTVSFETRSSLPVHHSKLNVQPLSEVRVHCGRWVRVSAPSSSSSTSSALVVIRKPPGLLFAPPSPTPTPTPAPSLHLHGTTPGASCYNANRSSFGKL